MANEQQDQTSAGPASERMSWRLTLRYDGPRIDLVSRRHVQMLAPVETGERHKGGEHAGAWLELRDGKENVLYHRDIARLIGAEAEVFSPDGTIRHVTGAPGSGQFEIVVPDRREATTVVVWSSPFESATTAARTVAREIARFPLRDSDQP